MTKQMHTRMAWVIFCLLLFACNGNDEGLQTYSLRVALDGAVVFADPSTRNVRILDVSDNSLEAKTRVHKASNEVLQAERRLGDHDQVLLFLRDRDVSDTKPAESSGLALVTKNGIEKTIALEPKFSAFQQSSDGKYAVLFGSGLTLGRNDR